MIIVNASEAASKGMPLYDMKELFSIDGAFQGAKISVITISPGSRVPEQGTGCHTGDEYSFFLSGEVYTESGDRKGTIGKGMATLIPRGEQHWCENRTDKPCTLVCVMVE